MQTATDKMAVRQAPSDIQVQPIPQRIFVLQYHNAITPHFDLLLEVNGVMKSWAIPRGPSMNPADRRLAIQLDDHPLSGASITNSSLRREEAAVIQPCDGGHYFPHGSLSPDASDRQLARAIRSGSLKMVIHGQRLQGIFWLLRLHEHGYKSWMLIKGNDRYAVNYPYDFTIQYGIQGQRRGYR